MTDRGWKALLTEAAWLEAAWPERTPPVMAALADKAHASPHALRIVLDAVAMLERPALLAGFATALAGSAGGAEATRTAITHLHNRDRWHEAAIFHEALATTGAEATPRDLLAHARCLEQLGESHRTGPIMARLAEATAVEPQLLSFIVDGVSHGGLSWAVAYGHALAQANPALLANAAKRLEKGGHWQAAGVMLHLLHRARATSWKTVAMQMARLRERGGGEAAERLVPLLADAALARRYAYKVVLDSVAGWLHDASIRLFGGEIAARSRRKYLATARQWIRRAHPWREAWMMAAPPPATEHDAWRESLAMLAYEESDLALADALLGTLREAPVLQALGPAPTPTASTLLFRNPPLLDALTEVVRERLETRDHVYIHVAAVSTGEEAYTLAAHLNESRLLDKCTLEASDYSPELLARARTGRVDRVALRAAGPAAELHFHDGPDGPRLRGPLLERIRFVPLDLLEMVEDPTWDLFVANNVLVHYPPALQARIVRNIALRVVPGGVACMGGQTNEGIHDALREAGLVPRPGETCQIHEGWTLQRRAWYKRQRPYWALPPCRPERGAEWRFASLFTKTG